MVRKLRVKAVGDLKLKHPSAGMIRPEGSLWPADQFTLRRLREGVITADKAEPPKKSEAKAKPAT
ncbi:hypothetical protein [Bradyrhizobium ivorense]|uniref:hypothetical protein n=1 Tax=Bradyrhizobium ivorense TaxID=2511166 RepID=UPI0010B8AC34|nr:hypothetical protein [Bradyrhizobium ivorense]VIO80109.1 hypothetical protein CI41S_70690 [Bradyrhizobium ivorense]